MYMHAKLIDDTYMPLPVHIHRTYLTTVCCAVERMTLVSSADVLIPKRGTME